MISDFGGMKTSKNILWGPKPKITYFTEPKIYLTLITVQDRRNNTTERNRPASTKEKKETRQLTIIRYFILTGRFRNTIM